MGWLVVASFTFVLIAQATPPQSPTEAAIVAEVDPGQLETRNDGVMALSAGRGWVRTRHVFSDFVLSFEMRRVTRETKAVVAIRSWPPRSGEWPRRGYAIDLTGRQAGVLEGRGTKVTRLAYPQVIPKDTDEWQTVTIECVDTHVTVGLNRGLIGTFAIEERAGLILFSVEKGAIELRNIEAQSLPSLVILPVDADRPASLSKDGTLPRAKKEVNPFYPPESARRGVQGRVEMEVLVLADGTVGTARVTRSLDADCDQAALAAVRRWEFSPGMREGKRVPMLVTVEMTFTLK